MIAIATVVPGRLAGQGLRGRVLDISRDPIAGALIELQDSAGLPMQSVITAASGGYQLSAPRTGAFRFRVAAIGYQPRAAVAVSLGAGTTVIPDIILQRLSMRLPDIVALGRGRYCGRSGVTGDLFGNLLESAHTALQVIDATIRSGTMQFEVARITTRTLYGPFLNFAIADTSVQPMTRWPVQSIDPDTLRVVGFSRTRQPGDESTREYYGPDPRVLFADWFLESHCFTVDKPGRKRSSDTLHLRFAPARKSRLVDVSGELVLDTRDLSLLQFSFVLKNLPSWMPDEGAGGHMQFSRLPSGLWMTRSWAIWAPIAGISSVGRRLSVAGEMETYGWVDRIVTRDTASVGVPRL